MKTTKLARSIRAALATSASASVVVANTLFASAAVAVPAAAPVAGQAIINQAVGTYDDGNSHNFYTTSNQVVVTVQNAPGVSVSATGGNVYTNGNSLVDSFIITNSGNAAATLSLPANAEQVTFPTGSAAATQPAYGYYESDPTTGSPQKYLLADINSQNLTIAPGATKQLWVTYPVPYGASQGTNTTSLSVTLTQAAVNAGTGNGTVAVAAQSATAPATATDTITNEAQLDLNTKFIDGSSATAGTLQIQTDAQNSGGMPAHGLQSAQSLVGSVATRPGIFIVQQIPLCQNCGGRTRPQLTAASTVTTSGANGYVDSGVAPLVVYTHDATMKTWDTTWQGTTVTAVGVYLTCTATSANTCLNGTTYPAVSGTQQSQNDGLAGLAPHPAVTILSTMNYPTGFHSSDPNAFSTLSNGAIMGNVNNDILAPTYTDMSGKSGTIDSSTIDLTRALSNTTPQNPVTGASNLAYDTSPASFGVKNGPLGNPEAMGTLDGGTTPTTNGDFTAFVLNGSAQGSAAYSVNNNFDTTSLSLFTLPPTTTYPVENTIRNEGTTTDSFTLTANTAPTPYTGASVLPNGWTVAFFSANADNSVGPALAGPNANTTPAIASGATFNYYAMYTPSPSALTLQLFTPYEAIVTATSVNSLSAPPTTRTTTATQGISDPTIHVMFVNGYVKMTKSATTDITTCSASINSLTAQFSAAGITTPACPGAKITYTVNYQNLAPDPTSGTGNISLSAKNFSIIEDGSGTTNPLTPQNASNWAQYSNGLTDLAYDAGAGNFNPAGTASDNAGWNGHWSGNVAGSTKFTDLVGELKPATKGSMQFSIMLKNQTAPPASRYSATAL